MVVSGFLNGSSLGTEDLGLSGIWLNPFKAIKSFKTSSGKSSCGGLVGSLRTLESCLENEVFK